MSETKIKKCNFCGKDVKVPKDEVRQVYYPTGCLDKYQKHEKIEKMALDLCKIFFGNPPIVNKKQLIKSKDIIKFCWHRAEEFYNYAKEKEREKGIKNEL